MKKTKRLLPGLLLPLLLASAALAATVTVMVQQTQLRKRPQFYAPAAATVKLGQKLSFDQQQSGWYHVTGGAEGWIHSSAVSTKVVKVGSGPASGTGETTAEEVTLAGKGFNAQVESSYKDKHGDLNFAGVDRMERRSLADSVLMAFLKAGGLIPAGARP